MRAIKFILAAMLLQTSLSAQTQHERFQEELLKLVYSGKLPIYDAAKKEIATLDSIYPRLIYESMAWLLGCNGTSYKERGETPPVYPHDLRYGTSPSTILGFSTTKPQAIPRMATALSYCVFDTVRYDENTGMQMQKNFAFGTTKKYGTINRKDNKLRQINAYYTTHADAALLYEQLAGNGLYRTKSIQHKDTFVTQDPCTKRYYLQLHKDHNFVQKFIDAEEITPGRRPASWVQLYQGYFLRNISLNEFGPGATCYCFVETKEGIWQIEDGHLVLYNNATVEMVRYKILEHTSGNLKLSAGDIIVNLQH